MPNTSPIYILTPVAPGVQIVNATGTTPQSLLTGGSSGTRVESISCCTSDNLAETLLFWLTFAGKDIFIGAVTLPSGAGYTTVSKVDALPVLSPSLGYLLIPASETLKVGVLGAVTSGKTTDIMAFGGDY